MASDARVVERPSRGFRVLLIIVTLILVAALIGLLWVLRAVTTTPERQPVLADVPGVELAFQAYGGDFGQLKQPFDVAFNGDRIYATEPDNRRVVSFDSQGQDGQLFVQGSMEGGLALGEYDLLTPMGVDVAEDGSVYVADNQKMAIVVFSPAGEKVRELPVMSPRRVTVKDGRVYVLSATGNLTVMDTEGNSLGQWGTAGRGPDQLADANGVAVDDEGNIYVADMNNYRIIALSPELEVLWRYGQPATTPQEQQNRLVDSPTGIAIGADGNLYFVETLSSQVQVLSREGELVSGPLGEFGKNDDQFYFPTGIAWMEENLFVVADRFHDRIVGVRLTPQTGQQREE